MPPTDFDPPPTRPVGRLLRALVRTACWAVPGLVTVPALQVLGLHVLEPRVTWTMLERSYEAVLDGKAPWVAQRPLAWDDAPHIARAVVASEDGRFFLHRGIDPDAICAALAHNRKGGRLRGGSTITQQVARNAFLWQTRSWTRKGLEVVYTGYLEALVGKDRILDVYLSIAETGPMVFGFDQGARHHFDRAPHDLQPSEAGRMAHLLRGPRTRSVRSPAAARRAAWVARNPGVFPDHPRFDALRAEADAEPWWPDCE